MRIAVIAAAEAKAGNNAVALAIVKGMQAMGHNVELLDAKTDDGVRLPSYDYVAIYAEKASFFSGAIHSSLSKMLATAGTLVGKKGAAFVRSGGLFSGKAMANLMRAMEKEGMCVNWTDHIANAGHAEALAKRIGA